VSSEAARFPARGPHRVVRAAAQGAFWFFLVKGLAWLVVPALLAFTAAG